MNTCSNTIFDSPLIGNPSLAARCLACNDSYYILLISNKNVRRVATEIILANLVSNLMNFNRAYNANVYLDLSQVIRKFVTLSESKYENWQLANLH